MKSHLILGLALLVGAAIVSGCADEAPPGASLGSASISKYVAVGNSLTAGYQSNALYASAQTYSFPKLIHQQIRAAGGSLGTFEQPLWGDPGNPDPTTGKAARYELIVLDPVAPVIGPRGLTPGSLTNSALTRPYDNLGLPGAPAAGFLDTTGAYQGSFGAAILRASGGFPKSQYLQTVALNPDLVTFWLGANDVLGYATTGGAQYAVTPSGTFDFVYSSSLGALRASLPNAKIVVATIPEVTAIPFFTTIGPKVKASLANTAFSAGFSFYYQKAGETGPGTGATKFDEAPGSVPLLTLAAAAYAPLINTATFEPYRKIFASIGGYPTAQSLGLDSTKPFGLHPQNPWPNAYVLDATEQANVAAGIAAFNTSIKNAANTNNCAVFDAHALFNQVASSGYQWAGQTLTAAYITGGLFSLDGVHPSSRGYGVLANEFLKAINNKYGTRIQPVNISSIPGLEAPLTKAGGQGYPAVSPELKDELGRLFAPANY